MCQSELCRNFKGRCSSGSVRRPRARSRAMRPQLRRRVSPRPGRGTAPAVAPVRRAAAGTCCPASGSTDRTRADDVRKPYSSRCDSAASKRPTTRNEALAVTRRSISLAVCSAPISTTPRLRPRSAISSTTSLIGLRPSRGAYLFSSSKTRKTSGSRPPLSFSSIRRLTTTPTTKRFARSLRRLMSMTLTWCLRQSKRWRSASAGRAARINGATAIAAASRRRAKAWRVPSAARGAIPSTKSQITSTSRSNESIRSPASTPGTRNTMSASPAGCSATCDSRKRSTCVITKPKLARLVVRVGEEEAQHALAAKLTQRPEVSLHALGARARVGDDDVPPLRRRPQPYVGERAHREAQRLVLRVLAVRQLGVRLVQPEQVFAFDVEDDGVRRVRVAQRRGVEQPVEQEQRVGRLRRNAADAADVDVGAAAAVEELEVAVDRQAVARKAGREARVAHFVEVQRQLAVLNRRPTHSAPRTRGHQHLALGLRRAHRDARHRDVRDRRDVDGQRAALGAEHIGVEARALVGRLDLVDDAVVVHVVAAVRAAVAAAVSSPRPPRRAARSRLGRPRARTQAAATPWCR